MLLHSLVTRACHHASEDSTVAKNMKATIKKELIKRFNLTTDGAPKDIHCPAVIAAFLDPRYKTLRFMSDDAREELMDYVAELLPQEEDGITKEEVSTSESPMEWSILDCLPRDVEVDLTGTCSKTEINQYVAEPVRTDDPLAWWRANETRYFYILLIMKFIIHVCFLP